MNLCSARDYLNTLPALRALAKGVWQRENQWSSEQGKSNTLIELGEKIKHARFKNPEKKVLF